MSEQSQPLADPTRLEQQLQVLDRLAAVGLEIAEALGRQATGRLEAEAPSVVQGDIGLAYDRVARAVRFTIALQNKLIRKHRAREEAEAPKPPRPLMDEATAALADVVGRPSRARRIVERVAKEAGEHDWRFEDRLREANERLHDEDVYGPMWNRPVSEMVAMICRELGLEPDWPSLAEELWAQQEICSDQVGTPLRAWLEGVPVAFPAHWPKVGALRAQPAAASP